MSIISLEKDLSTPSSPSSESFEHRTFSDDDYDELSEISEGEDDQLLPKEEPAEGDTDGRTSDGRDTRLPPTPMKRAGIVFFVIGLIWLAFWVRTNLLSAKKTKPEIIYASRYSKEFKYRPAASPIITETLKDGRIRLRGANPTAVPTPTPLLKKKKKPTKAKASSKRRPRPKRSAKAKRTAKRTAKK